MGSILKFGVLILFCIGSVLLLGLSLGLELNEVIHLIQNSSAGKYFGLAIAISMIVFGLKVVTRR